MKPTAGCLILDDLNLAQMSALWKKMSPILKANGAYWESFFASDTSSLQHAFHQVFQNGFKKIVVLSTPEMVLRVAKEVLQLTESSRQELKLGAWSVSKLESAWLCLLSGQLKYASDIFNQEQVFTFDFGQVIVDGEVNYFWSKCSAGSKFFNSSQKVDEHLENHKRSMILHGQNFTAKLHSSSIHSLYVNIDEMRKSRLEFRYGFSSELQLNDKDCMIIQPTKESFRLQIDGESKICNDAKMMLKRKALPLIVPTLQIPVKAPTRFQFSHSLFPKQAGFSRSLDLM